MKKSLFLLLLIGFSINVTAQITKPELYGRWSVQDVVEKSPKPEYRALLDGFGKATFTFYQNGDFSLTTTSKAPMFQIILQMTENTKWLFDEKEQLIKIGGEEDGYSIMGIRPQRNDSEVHFAMDESKMVFAVKKIEVEEE